MNDKQESKPVRIDLEEARELYERDNVTPLDVVDSGAYEDLSRRIEGAVRINPEDIEQEYQRLSKNDTILAY